MSRPTQAIEADITAQRQLIINAQRCRDAAPARHVRNRLGERRVNFQEQFQEMAEKVTSGNVSGDAAKVLMLAQEHFNHKRDQLETVRLETDFALMTGALAGFIEQLVDGLGGEATPAAPTP